MNKTIKETKQFQRDMKKIARSGRYNLLDFQRVVTYLEKGELLPPTYRDHSLVGNWKNHRECHIKPDWLLVYKFDEKSLTLVRMGSHSDLFF